MSETNQVEWFTDAKEPNRFFFRSPFKSWKFLINTVLLVILSCSYALILWRYWGPLNRNSFPYWMVLLTLLLLTVVYPFGWALRRHGKINRLYREGKISEQSASSPIDEVLDVADNAINEGLRNTSFLFGIFLLFNIFCLLEPFR